MTMDDISTYIYSLTNVKHELFIAIGNAAKAFGPDSRQHKETYEMREKVQEMINEGVKFK